MSRLNPATSDNCLHRGREFLFDFSEIASIASNVARISLSPLRALAEVKNFALFTIKNDSPPYDRA